jgi:hypothetical protein
MNPGVTFSTAVAVALLEFSVAVTTTWTRSPVR